MPKIPSELVEAFARGDGSIFVGAGLSMGVGYPGWGDLMKPIEERVTDCPPHASPIDIAQYFVDQHGRQSLIGMLRASLSRPRVDRTPVHDAMLSVAPECIFTTNFDTVIEDAIARHDAAPDVIVRDSDVSSRSKARRQVIKLHGDLNHAEDIVLTQEDFDDYEANKPAIADMLKVELQTRTVLFLGYGHGDPDLRMLLSRVRKESRTLRRNLFSAQLNPSKNTELALHRHGIVVVPLGASGDKDDANRALERWLKEFAQAIEGYRSQGVPARKNHDLPPRPRLVGRQRDAEQALKGLDSHTGFPLIAIEGFAGVGKTSLAVEVGYRCATGDGLTRSGSLFDYVVWVSAKDKPDQKQWLNDVLNAIAVTTHFPVITQLPIEELERKKTKVELLVQTYRVLVIIDNFETIKDDELLAWIERIPDPSKVLITTRNRQPKLRVWAVPLAGLEPEDALVFVREHVVQQLGQQFVSQLSDSDLRDLSNVTGGNPQALRLALGLVRDRGAGELKALVDELDQANPKESMDDLFKELFEQSWRKLGDMARDVLLVTPLFVGVSSIRRDALQAVTALASFDFRNALAECERLFLLEAERSVPGEAAEPRFAVHPMTRTFARRMLDERRDFEETARRRCTGYFLELVRDSVKREKPNRPYWNALVSDEMMTIDPEWPSVAEVMNWAAAAGDHETLVDFVMLLVHYMDSRLLNRERLTYVHQAIAALHELNRPEDQALLLIDALGWTYVEENRLEEAYTQIRMGFGLAEDLASRAGDDPRARRAADDLRALGFAWRARVRIEQGRVGDAESLIRQALSLECSAWIKCRVRMAEGDIALRRRDGANALRAYLEQARQAKEYDDEGHGYQWRPRIGMAYLQLGKLDEANRTFQELFEFKQIEIGRLYAEFGLAMVRYRRGDRQSARVMIDDIRARLERRTSSNLLLNMIEGFHEDLKADN